MIAMLILNLIKTKNTEFKTELGAFQVETFSYNSDSLT